MKNAPMSYRITQRPSLESVMFDSELGRQIQVFVQGSKILFRIICMRPSNGGRTFFYEGETRDGVHVYGHLSEDGNDDAIMF